METTIILTLRSFCLNSYFVPYELFEVALLDPGRGPRYPKCRDGRIENNLRIKKLATENHRKKNGNYDFTYPLLTLLICILCWIRGAQDGVVGFRPGGKISRVSRKVVYHIIDENKY
jgi:hypothetical protein